MLMAFIMSLTIARATESWLCTEESSQRMGDAIYACGIGQAATEDEARAKALDRAAAEFKGICDLTDTCRAHVITATPKRTTCEKSGQGFKCYRGLLFTASEMVASLKAKIVAKLNIPAKAKANPIIRHGMTIQEVISEVGKPYTVLEQVDYSGLNQTHKMMFFKANTNGCNAIDGAFESCSVSITNGLVTNFDKWNVANTDILEH